MHAHRVECHDIYKVATPAPCAATNVVVCLVVIVVPIDVIARDLPHHSMVVVVGKPRCCPLFYLSCSLC
jgi:hypothetical protein